MKTLVPKITVLISTIIIAACSGEDEKLPCIPASLQTYSDSLSFHYTSDRKLSGLFYYMSKNHLNSRDEFFYNSKKQLQKVNRYIELYPSDERLDNSYSLEYDAKGLPSRMLETGRDLGTDTLITTYAHDGQGRFTSASVSFALFDMVAYSYRYEYGDGNNVKNVYYSHPGFGGVMQEDTVLQNLTYDNKQTFYSGVKDLAVYNVYINRFFPSQNNCTSAESVMTVPAQVAKATITYGANGMIDGYSNTIYLPYYNRQYSFRDLEYMCN
jgi:hypothetical protein